MAGEDSGVGAAQGKGLRVWPAVAVVAAQHAVAYGFLRFGAAPIGGAAGLVVVPLVALLLLAGWWLFASRAAFWERAVFASAFTAAVFCVAAARPTTANDLMILAYALPVLMTGAVALLAATGRCGHLLRGGVLLGFLLACAAVFCALRVDAVGGNLVPYVSWRWRPSGEQRSGALPAPGARRAVEVPAEAGPGDWPGFRGAARDGCVQGARFSADWTAPPRELWRREVGPAYSSFAAMGDYVFTQEQRGAEELVTCYAAATGEKAWENRVDARYEDDMGVGPRSTPTFSGGRLFTLGGTGVLQCLDASTGEAVWTRNVPEDAGVPVADYGFTSSPLVEGDRVVVPSNGGDGAAVLAYDRATGEPVWRGGRKSPVYSSPHPAGIAGVAQVLVSSDFGVQSLAPDTGALLWEHAWEARTTPRCVQPLVLDGGRVMIGSPGFTGSRMIRVEKPEGAPGWAVSEVWTNRKFRPYFNDRVTHGGHCYGFDGNQLVCVDLETGAVVWEGDKYGGQLLLLADMGMLLVLSERGQVALVPATPAGFSEAARFKALSGRTSNHPVVAHGRLFVRNNGEAACYELPPAS
ncbi:MAG TPA: PQQ-like beta-propeller repeat protein [Candidatus Hydrogenedentes bacterium]|nr:PQQ-like beta-propeller repeat protein [Candidatus Hydrogenedentota bacterium]